MTGPVAGIVFDMDGTLIESHEVVPAAYRAAVRAGGGPERTDAEVIAAYSLGSPADLLTHLLGRPATGADLDTYHAELAALAERVTVYPGVTEVLAEVAARVPVGLFTGASHRAAEILLDRVGLLGRFRVVLGDDQVARPKPAPDGVELACRRLGVAPGRAAYVGDSPLDLRAARDSGAVAVAAAWGHQYDPAEAADVSVTRPGDLLALLG
ncbi:HAD-IA family hydrolase [Micromonospora terminaliae]|uniref:HAD-IA family hydrolase n=1 Tax=Micromonospora terminaliae TaxID=1914461 RepID=A0AAJ2ZCM8_9ACTN|nr:HAD-IA family hydrolase [Micromonospora terminaliae]NES27328.1 HAD-IA family hydrolase [Micromonospora terminaliae]QGL47924.1 HAD-IA family hydrolase [Micromonospora terminaliae]